MVSVSQSPSWVLRISNYGGGSQTLTPCKQKMGYHKIEVAAAAVFEDCDLANIASSRVFAADKSEDAREDVIGF